MTTYLSVRRLASGLALLLVAGLVLGGAYLRWRQGTPYQDPFVSPNEAYYVQKFEAVTWNRLVPAMPGQGSDRVDGFIRLYAADGTLLHERFATFIRDVRPIWADAEVYLMGLADMDDAPWLLPSPAE